ncbi:unnamed protein product (macronuclear) [Paramecium tetraurelia]|uniref:Uncharacterized protein n=1 Tax=Paramecium tetraurelia TaxID=5888 RepID=A0DF26_PARTE|nr:uncharacterized protein GSPATT00039461001 [Paramecium tetraurelia]CAK81643.1 unnamed protein product [Paramecium tetraurelia]|eukprot:XP_001449040.1 hypothetical protein (macronuclear) [Paramecium tetraurelia strain d4-2]
MWILTTGTGCAFSQLYVHNFILMLPCLFSNVELKLQILNSLSAAGVASLSILCLNLNKINLYIAMIPKLLHQLCVDKLLICQFSYTAFFCFLLLILGVHNIQYKVRRCNSLYFLNCNSLILHMIKISTFLINFNKYLSSKATLLINKILLIRTISINIVIVVLLLLMYILGFSIHFPNLQQLNTNLAFLMGLTFSQTNANRWSCAKEVLLIIQTLGLGVRSLLASCPVLMFIILLLMVCTCQQKGLQNVIKTICDLFKNILQDITLIIQLKLFDFLLYKCAEDSNVTTISILHHLKKIDFDGRSDIVHILTFQLISVFIEVSIYYFLLALNVKILLILDNARSGYFL